VGDDEVAKLLRHGEGWLSSHPEREVITTRYLKHRRSLINDALEQLLGDEDPAAEEVQESHAREEADAEQRISLNEQRLGAVLAGIKSSGAKKVLDLGCGEGRLLQVWLKDRQFEQIVGMDVSYRALEIAKDKLNLDRLPDMQRQRIQLRRAPLCIGTSYSQALTPSL
jgi:methylase of polypeptide subunit release factors